MPRPPAPRPELILDAVNLLHTWGRLTTARDTALGPALDSLVHRCLPLIDARGWQLWLAIDQRDATRPRTEAPHPHVTYAYAPSAQTADGLIEARLLAPPHPIAAIVSGDGALTRATLAAGRDAWTPAMLADACRAAQQSTRLRASRQTHGDLSQGLFG